MNRLILISIIIASITFSCGSKKKALERERVESVIEVKEKTIEVKQNDITTTKEVKATNQTLFFSESDVIELTQGDPNKAISMTDSNGNTTTFKGANVTIKKNKTATKTNDSTSTKEVNIDKSKESKEVELDTKSKVKTETKKKTTEKSGLVIGFWFWFWIFLLLIIAGAIYYFRSKIKTLLP